MITIGFFRNSREKQHEREIKNALGKLRRNSSDLPPFSIGGKELGLKEGGEEELIIFVKDWLKNPEHYLDHNNFSGIANRNVVSKSRDRDEACYGFPSFIDQSDIAKFYESKQPAHGRGERMAFIILPHWNACFYKYKHGTAFIRNFFLPVATYRYFPTYATEKDYKDKLRHDVVGPNIGLTIKRFWQDIINIQFFGKYLKEELGYEKVGIWSYSIGSPRGYLACMFSENIFDYLIMNHLADSFSESLLRGISTRDISKRLLDNLSEQELNSLFSPLNPGEYIKYIDNLPKHTRLVQGKHDLVFGEENNRKMVEKIKKHAPFVEIEFGNFGHTTCAEIEKVIPIIYRNSRFVFKKSNLRRIL